MRLETVLMSLAFAAVLLAASPPAARPSLRITILFDNVEGLPAAETAWGFSALVEYGDHRWLFDTGGDPVMLADNARALDVDLGACQALVLSHPHGDHIGGIDAVLEACPEIVVYLLDSFPDGFVRRLEERGPVIQVPSDGLEPVRGLYLTGGIPGPIPEQALVVDAGPGLVIITGCAHPGVVKMVEAVEERIDRPIELVIGGFHLGSASPAEVKEVAAGLKALGVRSLAPTHCTGEQAMQILREYYGEDYHRVGAGSTISFPPEG